MLARAEALGVVVCYRLFDPSKSTVRETYLLVALKCGLIESVSGQRAAS